MCDSLVPLPSFTLSVLVSKSYLVQGWVKDYSERHGQVLKIFPGPHYLLPPSSIHCLFKFKVCLQSQIQKKNKALDSRYSSKVV